MRISSARAAASPPAIDSASATTLRFSVSADGAGVSSIASSSSNMLPTRVAVAVPVAVVARLCSPGGAIGTSREVTPVNSSSATIGGGG